MNPVADRILRVAKERLATFKPEGSPDVRVVERDGRLVLEGSVDDAWAKSTVEQVARDVAGEGRVESRLRVRDELGAEAAAKETEFRDDGGPTETIPRPMR